MIPESDHSQHSTISRPVKDRLLQMCLGLALGVLLTLIPWTYLSFSTTAITLPQLLASAVFILFCGIIAAIWGNRFLGPLMKFLESIPPVG